ncbi:MAG: phosphate/phosphite/phosphonate ABC transporter substrate-binding protein [Deltaproteobacteria bacterium]|nr:phosphate/phosphite/phosphonate ABC transporter substrate-binding protein [Deltaproteobacteria bacterium]
MKAPVVSCLLVLLGTTALATELRIGLIPEQNVFAQAARYRPLGEYLQKKTGAAITFTILPRYGNIIDRFRQLRLDGAFFGSFVGALALERLGVEPIARPVNLDGTSTYRGYIFVRKDSGIRDVATMKGKRLAFVEQATTAGYVFPMAYFKEKGVRDVDRYFKEVFFAGSHDAAIHAVLDRKADVGCAKHSMFDRLARRDPRVAKELTILVQSPDVPSNGLSVRTELPAELKASLRGALLAMDKDPEGIEVLHRFEALRFIGLRKEDYRPVYEIAERAGIRLSTYSYENK